MERPCRSGRGSNHPQCGRYRARTSPRLPKGIGVYTSFFTLPPGGSSDSEGRAAASPVLLFRCLDTSHTSSCRLTFLELIRNTQFVCNRSANNDRARFVVNGIGDFLVMVRLLSSLACLRPSPLVTSRPSRREGESSTIPIVLRRVDTNALREGRAFRPGGL